MFWCQTTSESWANPRIPKNGASPAYMGLSSPSTPSSFLGEAGIDTGLNMTQHDSTINSRWPKLEPKLEPKLPLPCVDATSHAHDVAAVCTQLNQIPTAVFRRFWGFPGTTFSVPSQVTAQCADIATRGHGSHCPWCRHPQSQAPGPRFETHPQSPTSEWKTGVLMPWRPYV